jgi:two-component system cell cycle response regulator CtrA
MRGLLVEDDATTAEGLRLILTAAGITLDVTDSGREALTLVRHYDYDIVVLDLGLPDIDGTEVLRVTRNARIAVPVVVMSGLASMEAKIAALTAGADDYVTKPFDGRELTARVLSVIRRSKGFSQPALQLGALELDQQGHSVTFAGRPVPLTRKEFAILELMMLRKGMSLSKDAFLNHLYGGIDEPDAKIIDVFVCKLRKKLSEAGATDLIQTMWGCGYMIRDPARLRPPAAAALLPPPRRELSLAA